MAKLSTKPIDGSDLLEYLNGYSDFSFELGVLKRLRAAGLACEHSGLYEDPATKKPREFDIRASFTLDNYHVMLAVECKNIRDNFPVLVSCVTRHHAESFHEVALASDPEFDPAHVAMQVFTPRMKPLRIGADHSIYEPGEPVGKSIAQVGRASDGSITANDSELHEKWGQCLSSAADLVDRAYWLGHRKKEKAWLSLVLPVVVVPDGRLWTAIYDDDGNRVADPSQTDRCSCFIGRSYDTGSKQASTSFCLSHMEFMTESGLSAFVRKFFCTVERIEILFPKAGLREAYLNLRAGA